MKRFYYLIIYCFLIHISLSAETVARAAIDFGSGAVKVQVGLVDSSENRIIGKPLLEKHLSLSLTEDVTAHGIISEEMQKRTFTLLDKIKEEAQTTAAAKGYSQLQFSGIATAIFRKAPNGTALLKKFEEELAIPFTILSQEEEGKLGFMTAHALYPEIPERQLVAFDSGNASFQMSVREDGGLKVYQGPLGYGTVRLLLAKEIRQGPALLPYESGNPVSQQEADILAYKIKEMLPEIPGWLQKKLRQNSVVTYGNDKSLFPVIAEAKAAIEGKKEPVDKAVIEITDLYRMRSLFLDQGDSFFDDLKIYNRNSSASVYLLTLMEYLGIKAIQFKRSMGNTAGILISPQFWETYAETK